jgi:hypothetical protein
MLAGSLRAAYLTGEEEPVVPALQEQSASDVLPAWRRLPLVLAGVAGAALLIAAIVLWAQYGTAVFFELIAAGIAACF